MTRFAILSLGAAAVLPALLPLAPATAQPARINEIIVYGTDPCPRSTDDDVVVCARKPESERYRIPETLREGGSLQSRTNWAERATAIETHSRTGVNSCSPVGPAGHTGCLEQLTRQAFKERREQNSSDTAPDE